MPHFTVNMVSISILEKAVLSTINVHFWTVRRLRWRDMVEHSKPAPDIFLKACAELGVAPERAYAIEDSYNGIRAAHAGHLLPIMVPDLLPANEEMQEKAEVVLPDLFEVIAYLKGEGAC